MLFSDTKNQWMDETDLFRIHFNIILVILRWWDDNERLCVMEPIHRLMNSNSLDLYLYC